MQLTINEYSLVFENGGVEIVKSDKTMYRNDKPLYLFVLDYMVMTNFYDKSYDQVSELNGQIVGIGTICSPAGSEFAFRDCYEVCGSGFSMKRTVTVLKADESEHGFASKFTLRPTESSDTHDFNYFGPGVWYKQNDFVPPHFMGYSLDNEYFHWQETRYALPLFAMQNIASGETVAFSRLAADVTLRSMHRNVYNNYIDPTYTIGSIGMSQPKNMTLFYDDLNTTVTRLPLDRSNDPLGIDYVYPADNGETTGRTFGGAGMNPARRQIASLNRIFHPVQVGYSDTYGVMANFGCYSSYQEMLRLVWRSTNARLQSPIAGTDCELLYKNNMKLLKLKARKYNNSWGVPFLSFLPDAQDQNVDYQYGFVGQQPAIGYQLIRYGDLEHDEESYQKGVNIVDFWCSRGMSSFGAPMLWFNPPLDEFQYEPYWTRMIGDGMEGILDAYIYLHKKGDNRTSWYDACKMTADWLVRVQNEDGSYYRSYDQDGNLCMDSKANTTAVIRFLIHFYLVSGTELYKQAALKAGDWSYDNIYLNMEYRGGTCDNSDVYDKESAIYGVFGFLALFDLTGEDKWLVASCGAADYVATWTYTWSFPIVTNLPIHPFNKNNISGQSLIATGHSATDMYMAACSYAFYHLYLYTDDTAYLEFAEFLSKNPQQCNDVDGSVGYSIPGLCHEACGFSDQVLLGQYHWLPWCTFVEVDPVSRLFDTFGTYEITEAEKLPLEERKKLNRIYDNFSI
jgi:hypothetical protein